MDGFIFFKSTSAADGQTRLTANGYVCMRSRSVRLRALRLPS